MTLPLLDAVAAGPWVALGTALVIGVAFGWCLERAGLGSAPKLAGQFYLRDFTVFKVMFSAIVTAMLGVWWTARLGLLDPSRLYVPETFLWPQLVGGLLFGAGFVVAGLCPGTSCVAAASGRADGAMTVAGFFLGVLGTGLAFDWVRPLYESGARGVFLLPAAVGATDAVMVLVVTLTAVGGCVLATRLQGSAPGASHGRRLGAGAIVLAALAVVSASTPSPRAASSRSDLGTLAASGTGPSQASVMAPLDLAARLRALTPRLRVLDLREQSEFDEGHVASAQHCAPEQLATLSVDSSDIVVLYASNTRVASEVRLALLARGARDVRVLDRGFQGWVDDVLTPVLASDASPGEREAFADTARVSRYFGGTPRIEAPKSAGVKRVRKADVPAPARDAGSESSDSAAALRRWRRGC